jgi:ABC-2 type transport system permease protein
MMAALMREARFMLRERAALVWLTLAFVLSVAAVGFGIAEVREQRATIALLIEEDAADRANAIAGQSDWGGAAYYAFHLTYAPPSDFAFASLGQRDASPWLHRVRMLALEGQIHEADTRNADFALVGRFDFAFLAATVAPLLLILLLYDLRSAERVAGRHDLLLATAGSERAVWLPRAALRFAALALAVLVPFWAGAAIEGAPISAVLRASAMVLVMLLVWGAMAERIGRVRAAPATILTALVGVWLALALLVPAIAKAAIDARHPVPDGGDILLLQRESVNGAWDIPKQATMQPFIERHPEWAADADVGEVFSWTWYFAFQQVGDQTAEPLSRQYRAARLARDAAAGRAALFSPASLVERYFQHLARTDAAAMIAYEDAVRGYHAQLRAFYYPLLFRNEPYDAALLERLPAFTPAAD